MAPATNRGRPGSASMAFAAARRAAAAAAVFNSTIRDSVP